MTQFEEMAEEIFKAIREYVSSALTPLALRLKAIEARQPAPGKDGRDGVDGKSVTLDDVRPLLQDLVAKLPKPADGKDGAPGKDGRDGADGKSITLEDVRPLLEQLVAALPKAADGKDGAPGNDGRDGVDGKSITIEDVRPLLQDLVAKLPKPADGKDGTPGNDGRDGVDGKSITLDDVRPLLQELVAKLPKPADGKDGAPGKDGRDGRDAKDGRDGERGRDALEIDILPAIDETKSYKRGTFARHAGGLWRAVGDTQAMRGWECVVAGIATLSIEQVEDRRLVITATLSQGDPVTKEIRLEHPMDRGVYRPEVKYAKGDGVTWAGSWWIAQVDQPADKPSISDQWRLAVKRGRDGKDAEPK